MNTSDFSEILQNPAHLKNEQIFDLENVLQNFPFFQAARVLYLKGLKNQNSFRYNQNLKTTAVHTTDRSVLFHFITSDTFYDNQLKEIEATIIQEIDIVDKNVLLNINKDVSQDLEQQAIEIDPLEPLSDNSDEDVLYIDETSLENLQKEVAEGTHNEEIKLLSEKSEKEKNTYLHPAFKYSNSIKSNGFVFEIDTDDTILTIDESAAFDIENDPSEAADYNISFEPINEGIISKISNEQSQTEPIEIALGINEPIHFNPNDTHLFSEWLQLSILKPIDRSSEVKTNTHQDKKMELIDVFIDKNPKIKSSKLAGFTVNFDQVEEMESDVVMTETLARVYIDQKKYDSAIEAYEVLSLKFPEKSSFFADQIKMLENLK